MVGNTMVRCLMRRGAVTHAGPCRGRFTHVVPLPPTRAATGWCIGGPCRLPSRSAETTIRPFRPPLRPPAPTTFSIAWHHRCRIIGWGQLAACLAPRLYGSLAPSRSCVPRDPDASTVDRARSAMRRRLRVTLALYTPCLKQLAHPFRYLGWVIRRTADAVLHPCGVFTIRPTTGFC
jgi:hypothetical protein